MLRKKMPRLPVGAPSPPKPKLKTQPKAPSLKSAREIQAVRLDKTRRENSQEIAEDYVEAIADLITAKGQARVGDLALLLGVTHVTVSRTITRLKIQGYTSKEPFHAIGLTAKGSQLATFCKQRHETVIEFLRAVGVPNQIAENDAEGIEHHVSPETLATFRKFLAAR